MVIYMMLISILLSIFYLVTFIFGIVFFIKISKGDSQSKKSLVIQELSVIVIIFLSYCLLFKTLSLYDGLWLLVLTFIPVIFHLFIILLFVVYCIKNHFNLSWSKLILILLVMIAFIFIIWLMLFSFNL